MKIKNMPRPWMLLVLASLGACTTAGPDFQPPKADLPRQWQRHQDSPAASMPGDGAADLAWWNAFGDPLLTTLARRALANNLDLQAASARLLQSRWSRRIVASAAMPSLQSGASVTRIGAAPVARLANSDEVLPGVEGSAPVNLYQYGFDAAWEIDLWGRTRRAAEQADAASDAAAEVRHGVMLAVLTETAASYVQLRATQATGAAVREMLALARHNVQLTMTRRGEGAATRLEVSEAAAQAGAIEAQLPELDAQEGQLMNALALLLGETPGALAAELAQLNKATAIPPPPARIPLGLPSELARRRPDIRQAEAQLHAATAGIGMAKADFYPSLTLSAGFSMNPMSSGSLGDWASRRFAFGPSLNLPLFNGGRLAGAVKLREAQQQEAAIRYQKTVLNAWHEIDDTLLAYGAVQRRRAILQDTIAHHQDAYDAALARYRAGAATLLDVLPMQRNLLQAQTALLRCNADVSLTAIRLYKALGGGWENAANPQPPSA